MKPPVDMDRRTLYLHIGLPKTGTTFLQEEIFPALPALRFFNKPQSPILQGKLDPIYGIMDRYFSRSALVWQHQGDRLFADVLGLSKDTAPQENILISDEGVGAQASRPVLMREHLTRFAEKASAWGFTHVRLFCVIRRQDRWLASHYAQLSDRKANASQKAFETYVRDWLSPSAGRYLNGIRTDYKALHEELVAALGQPNVLMLPYEWLDEDPAAFLECLFEFLELADAHRLTSELAPAASRKRSNQRSTAPNSWQLRRREVMDTKVVHLQPARIFQRLKLPTALPLPWPETEREASIELTPALSREILAVYGEGNRRLAADLGLDLGRYGYYAGDGERREDATPVS